MYKKLRQGLFKSNIDRKMQEPDIKHTSFWGQAHLKEACVATSRAQVRKLVAQQRYHDVHPVAQLRDHERGEREYTAARRLRPSINAHVEIGFDDETRPRGGSAAVTNRVRASRWQGRLCWRGVDVRGNGKQLP